jgi:hypothetical protein
MLSAQRNHVSSLSYFLLAPKALPALLRKQIMHVNSTCLRLSDDRGTSAASLPSSATHQKLEVLLMLLLWLLLVLWLLLLLLLLLLLRVPRALTL